ncbi:hypothetical protein ACGF13_19960 [Kitasatospora sp. NPDC048286]|uniref:hypothetical protein n=1 Tax=Kitasatospora sp. NPDC048286 TaxID=3364047 RepID=UPI0037114D3E
MDSEIAAMAEVLRAARAKIREEALPKARTRRAIVPEVDEAVLFKAVVDLVDTARELAQAVGGRMTTPDGRTAHDQVHKRLGPQVEYLREWERKITPLPKED